ncbi:hypothetical protein TNCV_1383591 [Trichonephila clavipes]|nr:hypothetical protein TNCV_1383591 [Trichonephila clavipes]
MTRNMLPGLASLVYGYGNNLTNPLTRHVDRGLFQLARLYDGYGNVSTLSDHLHPFMLIVHSNGLREFQQNNATPYTSRIAAYWLQEHFSELAPSAGLQNPRHENI